MLSSFSLYAELMPLPSNCNVDLFLLTIHNTSIAKTNKEQTESEDGCKIIGFIKSLWSFFFHSFFTWADHLFGEVFLLVASAGCQLSVQIKSQRFIQFNQMIYLRIKQNKKSITSLWWYFSWWKGTLFWIKSQSRKRKSIRLMRMANKWNEQNTSVTSQYKRMCVYWLKFVM